LRHALRTLLAGAALSAALPASALAAEPAAVPQQKVLYHDGYTGRYLLDGAWYFRLDPLDQGLAQGLERQVSLTGWTAVTVPNAWNAKDLSDASQRGTVGWYRKDFRLPKTSRGAGWVVRFESVNYRARMYLNGRQIGTHEGAYLPFEIPLTKARRTGVNHLVVRVDNRRSDTDLPPLTDQDNGTPGGGWWNYGGLLREVYLRKVFRVDLTNFLARPILPCRHCDATVLLTATMHNLGGGSRSVAVHASVGGATARFATVKLAPHGTRQVSAKVKIRHPHLWEPGHPLLYRVRAGLSLAGHSVAGYVAHIGIRSIRLRRGRLLINGVPVTLRGVGIHEDNPNLGAALNPAQRHSIFDELRSLGATVVRAHYPLHPNFLEMADRAGVLVWDEIPFYRLGDEALKLKSVRDKGLTDLEEMIQRDQNHPSVLAWSIGNELPSHPDPGQSRYLTDASAVAKRLDPTRLLALDIAGYPSVGQVSQYDHLTALGINDYFGWYPGPSGQLVDRNALSPYLDQMRQFYPSLALFVTEFGAEANHHGPADEKGTYEFQNDWMQFQLGVIDSKPFIDGAMAWTLRDFKVRPGWDGGNPQPDPPWFRKGLSDQYGLQKPVFATVQRIYQALGTGH
jgi:beta-glucuronidase